MRKYLPQNYLNCLLTIEFIDTFRVLSPYRYFIELGKILIIRQVIPYWNSPESLAILTFTFFASV